MGIIQIRKAKISDWRFVRHLIARECLNIDSHSQKLLLCDDLQNVYIGVLNGKLSGFVHVSSGSDVLTINTLCVRYRDRRKNVGASLIFAALSAASTRGASTVIARTRPQSAAIQQALEKAGFDREDDGQEVLYWTEIGARREVLVAHPSTTTKLLHRLMYWFKFNE